MDSVTIPRVHLEISVLGKFNHSGKFQSPLPTCLENVYDPHTGLSVGVSPSSMWGAQLVPGRWPSSGVPLRGVPGTLPPQLLLGVKSSDGALVLSWPLVPPPSCVA